MFFKAFATDWVILLKKKQTRSSSWFRLPLNPMSDCKSYPYLYLSIYVVEQSEKHSFLVKENPESLWGDQIHCQLDACRCAPVVKCSFLPNKETNYQIRLPGCPLNQNIQIILPVEDALVRSLFSSLKDRTTFIIHLNVKLIPELIHSSVIH